MTEAVAGQTDIFDLLGDPPAPPFTAYHYQLDRGWDTIPCGFCGKVPTSLAAEYCGGGTARVEGIGVLYIRCSDCAFKPGRWNPPPQDQWTIKEHP